MRRSSSGPSGPCSRVSVGARGPGSVKLARAHGKVTGSRTAAKGWRRVPARTHARRSQDMLSRWIKLASLGLFALTPVALTLADEQGFRSLFDGTSGKGWILCDRKPLPQANVQPDGLNPHGT